MESACVLRLLLPLACLPSAGGLLLEKLQDTLLELGQLSHQAFTDLLLSCQATLLVFAAGLASPWFWLGLLGGATALYYLHLVLLAPMNRVRLLEDIGYVADGRHSKKDLANRVRSRRRLGELPPVYPNGWFAVCESRNVAVGECRSVSGLGLQLAVFRAENGEAHVVDAYCPHLGANLAVGGRVFNDCIECPFHGWRFRGEDGVCTHIPYLKEGRIPDFARVKSYTVHEVNGAIHIWYHAEGVEPSWKLPEMEHITSGRWAYRGRTEHYVNTHIEEVPENGADIAHLSCVHEAFLMAGSDLEKMWSKVWDFGKHMWKGEWRPDEEAHSGSLWLKHSIKLFGRHISAVDIKVRARQIGPSVVYLIFNTPFGEGVYIHTLLPIEPLMQKMVHQIYFTWYIPPIVPKFYLLAEALMIERDIMIWNNKQYLHKPMMVKSKEDGLLMKHRRWYSQFYSEHSPRLDFKKESMDW